MLTMEVEPIICEEIATEPIVAVPCEEIAAPVTDVIQPEITVKVGSVNPLKEALDKTCVDNCSDEFEKIGKLLDDRHALLAKVKLFGDDLHTFNKELRKHVGKYKTNTLSDSLRLNQSYHDVKNFDWRVDRHMKEIEDQLKNMQSLQKNNEKMLEQASKKTDIQLKNYKQIITNISKQLGTATYEISNLTGYNKTYEKDLATIKDLVAKLSDTVTALSNGITPATKPKPKSNFLDADDDISEALSVHELKFGDPDVTFKPVNVPQVQAQMKPTTKSQLSPATPTIAVISPTASSASSSLSSFDNIADIPSTVDEVEESYANNRDGIQGNTNKLDVLYETDDEIDGRSDSSFNTLSSDELTPNPRLRQSISPEHLDELLKALKEDVA